MNNNIGRKVSAGTAAIVSVPFGVASSAVGGTYNILHNTVSPIVDGIVSGDPIKVVTAPVNTITSTVDMVTKTVSSVVTTPMSVYQAVDSGEFTMPEIKIAKAVSDVCETANKLPENINQVVDNTSVKINEVIDSTSTQVQEVVNETKSAVNSMLTKAAWFVAGATALVITLAIIF